MLHHQPITSLARPRRRPRHTLPIRLIHPSRRRLQPQRLHQLPPRLIPPLRMPHRRRGVRIRQRPTKQLQRDPALEAGIEKRPRNIQHRQVPAAVLLEGKQPRVPRPAHPARLRGIMPLVAVRQRRLQPLPVHDLQIEHLLDVDALAQPRERGPQLLVGVGRLAARGRRVRVDPSGQVECVQADAEVGPVHGLDDLVGGFPGVDVVSPRESLVDEAEGRALLQAEVCGSLEVRDDDVSIACRARFACLWVGGEEVGWDLDEVCV